MKRVFGTLLACGVLCASSLSLASAETVEIHPEPNHKVVHNKVKKVKKAKGRKAAVRKVAPKKVAG
jgi:3-deoxy-D-manno-octulosonate 8-phosphate phosphatase KdsC-like HAD superfamily phosphatase